MARDEAPSSAQVIGQGLHLDQQQAPHCRTAASPSMTSMGSAGRITPGVNDRRNAEREGGPDSAISTEGSASQQARRVIRIAVSSPHLTIDADASRQPLTRAATGHHRDRWMRRKIRHHRRIVVGDTPALVAFVPVASPIQISRPASTS